MTNKFSLLIVGTIALPIIMGFQYLKKDRYNTSVNVQAMINTPTITNAATQNITIQSTQIDLLPIYKEILDSSRNNIDNSQKVITAAITLIIFSFSILGLQFAGGIYSISKINKELAKSNIRIIDTHNKITNLHKEINYASQESQKMIKEITIINQKIEILKNELSGLNKQNWYKEIEQKTIITGQKSRLFSYNLSECTDALYSLEEYLKENNRNIRLYVLEVLIQWVNEEKRDLPKQKAIIKRMIHRLLSTNKERLIKIEAEKINILLKKRNK